MHRLLKRQIKKYLPEEDLSKFEAFLEAVNQAYNDYDDDHHHLERILELSSKELFNLNQELKNKISLTEAKAKDSLQRLNEVITTINDVFFQLDEHNLFTLLNPAWEKITGFSLPETIGKSITEFIKFDTNFTLNKDDFFQQETVLKSKYGDIKYLEVTFNKLTFRGEKAGYSGVIRDVTQRKKDADELYKALEIAKKANQAKSEFLSVISHEIRTPLNAVVGISDLLLYNDPKEEQLENLEALQFSSKHLLSLINDVLDYSKMEAGKLVLEEIPFSLSKILNGIHETFKKEALEKNIQFTSKIAPQIPDKLIGDPTRLTQLLNNLVSNSIKFTNEGQVVLSVDYKTEKSGYVILFKVSDTGIGIPQEFIELIFESFSQVGIHTARTYGGTGLGLAIVKRLIDLHNTKIYVSSELNKGSEFEFSIYYEEDKKQSSLLTRTVSTNLSFEAMKVLVVDDNSMNILITKQFLKHWNVEVFEAGGGKEAIESLKKNDVDVVLLDVQMPEMDGYETCKTIRSNKTWEKLPIIAFTADASEVVHQKTVEAGMNEIVYKPFNAEDLFLKIQKVIN